jgi:tetratricopeptide (TPR) repeat protein
MPQHLAKAAQLVALKRPELAEREIYIALQANPESALAYTLLSQVQLALDQKGESLASAKKAISLDPELARAYYMASHAYYALDQLDLANKSLREALRLDPTDPAYYAMSACFHANAFDWESVLKAANAGLRIDPNHLDCLDQRSIALNRLGRTEEAKAAVSHAISVAPDISQTHQAIGNFFLNNDNPEQAYEHFVEARRLTPTDARHREDVLVSLGRQQPLIRSLWKITPVWYYWQPRARWCLFAMAFAGYLFLLGIAGFLSYSSEIDQVAIWSNYTVLWKQGTNPHASMAASLWSCSFASFLQIPFCLDLLGMGIVVLRLLPNVRANLDMIRQYGIAVIGFVAGCVLATLFSLMPGLVVIFFGMGLLSGFWAPLIRYGRRWPISALGYVALVALTILGCVTAHTTKNDGLFYICIILFFVESYFGQNVSQFAVRK